MPIFLGLPPQELGQADELMGHVKADPRANSATSKTSRAGCLTPRAAVRVEAGQRGLQVDGKRTDRSTQTAQMLINWCDGRGVTPGGLLNAAGECQCATTPWLRIARPGELIPPARWIAEGCIDPAVNSDLEVDPCLDPQGGS